MYRLPSAWAAIYFGRTFRFGCSGRFTGPGYTILGGSGRGLLKIHMEEQPGPFFKFDLLDNRANVPVEKETESASFRQ